MRPRTLAWIAIALLLAGCSRDGEARRVTLLRAPPSTAPGSPPPWPGPQIKPGPFESQSLQPKVRLTVSQLGWYAPIDQPSGLYLVFDPDEPAAYRWQTISVQPLPSGVFGDPLAAADRSRPATAPPADFIAWLEGVPQVVVTRLPPGAVAGRPTQRALVDVARLPSKRNYARCGGARCLLPYEGSDGQPRALYEGDRYELIIPSPPTPPLMILIAAPTETFDDFRAATEPLLSSMTLG